MCREAVGQLIASLSKEVEINDDTFLASIEEVMEEFMPKCEPLTAREVIPRAVEQRHSNRTRDVHGKELGIPELADNDDAPQALGDREHVWSWTVAKTKLAANLAGCAFRRLPRRRRGDVNSLRLRET